VIGNCSYHFSCYFPFLVEYYFPVQLEFDSSRLSNPNKVQMFPLFTIRMILDFPSDFHFTCQSKSIASLGLENICFKQSITGRYHITRAV
jgi:hypothetical protein